MIAISTNDQVQVLGSTTFLFLVKVMKETTKVKGSPTDIAVGQEEAKKFALIENLK